MFKIRLKGELGSTDRAAIIVKTVHNFEFTANEVFEAIDSDDAWRWLAPCCGVQYLTLSSSGERRGVGMTRYMGAVRQPLRWVWRQHEVFTAYEAGRRVKYEATQATWPLLRLWVEEYVVTPTSPRSCSLTWTVWWTPILMGWLPLRWTEPIMRWIFTVSIRPGLRRLVRKRSQHRAVISRTDTKESHQ